MLLLGSLTNVVLCFPLSFRRPVKFLSRAKQYDLVCKAYPGCTVQFKYLSCLTLQTAVVTTVLSLLGSDRHGQATLYPFQKHLVESSTLSIAIGLLLLSLIFVFYYNLFLSKI
jgi:hypothetical protein